MLTVLGLAYIRHLVHTFRRVNGISILRDWDRQCTALLHPLCAPPPLNMVIQQALAQLGTKAVYSDSQDI